MKTFHIAPEGAFGDLQFKSVLLHESEHFKLINFNFKAGQSLPVHSHPIEGQLSIVVLTGEGEFLGEDSSIPARAGDVLVCDIATPHGVRATTDMQVLVTIAPPI